MQALGAYGFLSTVKGKKYFLNHIPEGLRLLREDLFEAKNEYPALDELVKKYRVLYNLQNTDLEDQFFP